ncbi:MAG TPA: hypothetical protein VGL76_02355 [Gaiellaceae bacterium]|jgi:hypothetical protein
MKKLAICLTAGIAALLPASAAGRASLVPPRTTAAALHAWYVNICKANQGATAAFAVEYGIGPHHLHALQRCVTLMARRARG